MICQLTEKENISELLKFFFEVRQLNEFNKSEESSTLEYNEIKLAIIASIENFLRKPAMNELTFPLSFSVTEQRLVKLAAEKLGLICQVIKKSKHRSLVVIYKSDILSIFNRPFPLNITWNSRRAISQVLLSNPLTLKEKQEIQLKTDRDIRDDRHRSTTGKLMGAVPQVPIIKANNLDLNYLAETQKNHVWGMENEIIDTIKKNPIVIIVSAATCGKTTQIAQMVMQDCGRVGEPCRMICTQPYRLTAHANAQFVTHQRKENIGQTVGYQIRLESKVSPRTLLTFCTNEVLLRTLYGDRAFLNGTTHIIIDELQERSQRSDLLLAVLRKMQKIHNHLKIIILISTPISTNDIDILSILDTKNSYYYRQVTSPTKLSHDTEFVDSVKKYLDYCPVLYIRKPAQDVEELFLDDILKILDCKLENIEKNKYLYKVDLYKLTFENWLSCWAFKSKHQMNLDFSLFEQFYKTASPELYSTNSNVFNPDILGSKIGSIHGNIGINIEYNDQIDYPTMYDEILWSLWSRTDIDDLSDEVNLDIDFVEKPNASKASDTTGNSSLGNNYFKMLLDIVTSGNICVNHQHRMSGLSALMICAFRGFKNAVKRLLSLGADVAMPLVVTETIFHAFQSFLSHLQSTKQVNNTMLLFHEIYATRYYHVGTVNVLYASDLAIITMNYETVELIIGKVACESEGTYAASEFTSQNNHVAAFRLINHDLFFKIIFGILDILDKNTESGTILIFLPDYNDLIQLKCHLLNNSSEIFNDKSRYQIYLLHSRMMIQDLNSLLLPNNSSCRKIVLSTSIGESCMNIGEVSFVIDSGLESKRVYDDIFKVSTYKTISVSKSQVALRASRATKGPNRICFHLFSLTQYLLMDKFKVPGILTSPLNEVILQIKLLTPSGVTINQFIGSMLDSPNVESVKASMMLLKSIEALDYFDELTELGYHLYDLPLDPKYGKMVVSSVILKCLDPILTISCILNYQDPFISINCDQASCDLYDVKKKFASNTFSDHIVLLRAFQFWQKAKAEGWESTFCQKNFLSSAVFEIIIGIRTRLLGQLRASGFVKARGNGDIRDLNYNSENWAVVKAAIVSGLSNNYLYYSSESGTLVTNVNAKVRIHPSSILHSYYSACPVISTNHNTNMFIYDKAITVPNISNLNWYNYEPMMTNNKTSYVNYITMVTPITVALVGSNVNIIQPNNEDQKLGKESWRMKQNDSNDVYMSNVGHSETTLEFKVDDESSQLISKLRQKWQSLFLRKLKNPAKQYTPQDETILRSIVNVLTLEEQYYGLKQPSGVGARPRPMAPESCNQNDLNLDNNKGTFNFNPKVKYDSILPDGLSPYNLSEQTTSNWLLKNKNIEKKNVLSISSLQIEKSKLFNNGTNHFFIIKLLHDDEMLGIIESKIYKVNTGLKQQIENLLFGGFNIYFIFISGDNNNPMGYAKVLHIIIPEYYEYKNTVDETFSKDVISQTFCLSIEVFFDNFEIGVSAKIIDFLSKSAGTDLVIKETLNNVENKNFGNQISNERLQFITVEMPCNIPENISTTLHSTPKSVDIYSLTNIPGKTVNVKSGSLYENTQISIPQNFSDKFFMMNHLQNSNKFMK